MSWKQLAPPVVTAAIVAGAGWLVTWGSMQNGAQEHTRRFDRVESRVEKIEERQGAEAIIMAETRKDVAYIKEAVDELRRRR